MFIILVRIPPKKWPLNCGSGKGKPCFITWNNHYSQTVICGSNGSSVIWFLHLPLQQYFFTPHRPPQPASSRQPMATPVRHHPGYGFWRRVFWAINAVKTQNANAAANPVAGRNDRFPFLSIFPRPVFIPASGAESCVLYTSKIPPRTPELLNSWTSPYPQFEVFFKGGCRYIFAFRLYLTKEPRHFITTTRIWNKDSCFAFFLF